MTLGQIAMSDQFVVIEWNQASHQPRVADDTLYTEAEALERASDFTAATRETGRRERFTVARIEHAGEDDE